jgi:hypothetical protein
MYSYETKPLTILVSVSTSKGESWVNLLDVSMIERRAINGVTFIMKNGERLDAYGEAQEYRDLIKEAMK